MKLPKIILLNLNISLKKAERSRSQISFYPRWILPLKLLIIFFILLYVTGYFYYQNILNEIRVKLILDILLFIVILFPLLAFLKNLIFSFIENLKVKSESSLDFSPPVSVLLFLGNEKNQNMKSIESLLELDYPSYELILLSNSEAKYSNVDKNLIGFKKSQKREIKISLLHSKNMDQINLINTGLKVSSSKYILLLQPEMVVDKNALTTSMKHFKSGLTSVVVGRRESLNSRSMLQRIFAANNYIDFVLLQTKSGSAKTNLRLSEAPITFKNEKNNGIEFISLGKHNDLAMKINNNWSSKIIYDSDIKLKEFKRANDRSIISSILENDMLKFYDLIQQWNILYLKNHSVLKRLMHDWQIFKLMFFPIFQLVLVFILIFTAAATANFEYLIYWAIFTSAINILKTLFSAALELSTLKNIFTSLLFKWIIDLLGISFKVFSFNKSLLINSLNYIRMKN